ncbi:MAG: T9SS type A sorting domain-containing protein [Lentisphaeria bacterium]|nr:T9SS type A sorting domain-containing protein [Candidatus Neomarinimicrobiota bacterium]MCF7842049.1 T9SS type A sorting domain-containing protein [Lentisphaeria bacterium]
MFKRTTKRVLLFTLFTTFAWTGQGHGPLALKSVIEAVPEAAQSYSQWQTFQRGDYLIIGQDDVINSPYIPFFKRFKEGQGFRVSVAGLSETGATATEIKAYIQNFYQTHNLEYVLLIGDVTGWAALPSFTIGSENDVTDLPYVLLEGDDYLPEAIVGRWPIDTQTELGVIVNKTMNYSQTPYAGSDWLDRALVVAGNYADTGVILTPVWTSSWLARELGNFGYTSVDTVYYPPTTTPEQIRNIMNSGVGIVNYRGWGDAHGWHFPQFHVSDFDAVQGSLNNGFRLPVVFSFVCGTGKFDSPIDPAFGEALLSRGTVSTPSGAVAVVAPSDLHTRTKYNNALNSIMWDALLEGRVHELGPALTAAKFGFLNEFADQTGPGEMGEFYFHTYNILGDPSLPIWLLTPEAIDVTVEDFGAISEDDAVMVLDLPAIPDGVFALKRGDTLIGSGRWENGQVRVYAYDGAAFGTEALTLTLNAPQRLPVTLDITPAAGTGIGMAGYDDLVYPGVATLTPVFSNTTGSSVDAQVTFSSLESEYSQAFSVTIPAGGNAAATPVLAPVIHIGDREVVLHATINGDACKIAVPVMPVTASMDLDFAAGHQPNPGETFAWGLVAQFQNLPLSGDLTAAVSSTVEYLTITQNTSPATIQDGVVTISPNAFEATLTDVASGSKFPLHVALQMDGEPTPFFQQTILVPVGGLTAAEPTPPDEFGYWAYDDTDLAYEEAPVYNWTELSTHAGAAYYPLEDDDHTRVELPFTFTYYGNVYNGLTISSNGWASFEAESIDFFRNWSIPFPLGPGAMVSPFWDDLDYVDGSGDLIDIYTLHDEATGKFIVEWHEVRNGFGDHSFKETFQLILYDPATQVAADGNGVIEFQYDEVNDVDQSNNYSTVGIESPDQNDGIQYVYNRIYAPGAAELAAGRVIRFTTNAPANYYSDLADERGQTPETFLVGNAYPNPFNPSTRIPVALAGAGDLQVTLYNLLGQVVRTFSRHYPAAGEYSVKIDGELLPSGVYLVALRVGEHQRIQKITFLK